MQLPARIGKYELVEFLGGGMSHVYRAIDTVIDRTVAIKILTELGCSDEETRARFLLEARTAARVSHPNIVPIYDYGEDQGRPYLVMEFLRGEDLRKAILNGHTGDMNTRLDLALQIARALEYIHAIGITHRDIKPENVSLDGTGSAKLMDFGIAKSEGPGMTRAGYVIGTPFFMAPEQIIGKPVTHLVDVYSYGALLFELFTGTRLVAGENVERIFYKILHEPVDLTPVENAGAPKGIAELIARCTAKDPAARIQSFREIRNVLERLSRPSVPVGELQPTQAIVSAPAQSAEPASAVGRPDESTANRLKSFSTSRWAIPLAIGIFVLVTGAVLAVMTGSRKSPPPAYSAVIRAVTGDMLFVPGGPFRFGANKTTITLPAFYIDRTEVSNGAFQKFCDATGHPCPKGLQSLGADLPVVNVTIDDAREFAHWAHKRIPSGQEWEKAARGADGREYPWGNDADSKRANVATASGKSSQGLVPVDAFASDHGPYGTVQMCGNVWELVEEPVEPSERDIRYFTKLLGRPADKHDRWASIRGGAFDLPLAVTYEHATIPASYASANIGFRCVADTPPAATPATP